MGGDGGGITAGSGPLDRASGVPTWTVGPDGVPLPALSGAGGCPESYKQCNLP